MRPGTEGPVADAVHTFAYKIVRKVIYNKLGAARQHILLHWTSLTMPDSSASAADLGQHELAVVAKSFSSFKVDY